jgi:hypothetical protein
VEKAHEESRETADRTTRAAAKANAEKAKADAEVAAQQEAAAAASLAAAEELAESEAQAAAREEADGGEVTQPNPHPVDGGKPLPRRTRAQVAKEKADVARTEFRKSITLRENAEREASKAAAANQQDKNDCPLCLQVLGSEGSLVAELQCGHTCCEPCLDVAIKATRDPVCFKCRRWCLAGSKVRGREPSASERRKRMALFDKSSSMSDFTTRIYSAVAPPLTYLSIEDMLALAHFQWFDVEGDGNCGYYAFVASGNCDSIQHCMLRMQGRRAAPTATDYARQQALRNSCVDWWLKPERAGILKKERSENNWAVNFCISKKVGNELVYPHIEKHRLGRNKAMDGMGVYACDPMLRAMAAVEGSNLVIINSAKNCDKVYLFPPDSSDTLAVDRSWAEDIVPYLIRQHAGKLEKDEAPLRVVIWNGRTDAAGHFQATRLAS